MTEVQVRDGRTWRASVLLGICCLLIYNANWRAISAGDTYPARYLPFAIWKHQTVLLDPITKITRQGRGGTAFWAVPVPDGHTISLYPVVLPVLIAPLYLPAVGYLELRGWTDARLDRIARVMEKLTASLIASIAAALLFVLLRRRASMFVALLLTIAYAFGTSSWGISSQALWQHGIAQLLVIVTLLLLTSRATTPRVIAVGLVCSLIAMNRPPDAIIAAALGIYALVWAGRRRVPLLIAAAVLPALLVLAYNIGYAGHIGGGYGLIGKPTFFRHDLLAGITGLLFSPTRGLFVFSPFFLFLVFAWRHRPSNREERFLTLAMAVAVVLQILIYSKTDWRAGISWGTRFMTDLMPFLVWMLVPVVAALRSFGRVCFMLAVAGAIVIQIIGAFFYTGDSDGAIYAIKQGPDRLRAAWNWKNAPFIASLRNGPAPMELTIQTRGHFDAIKVDGRAASTITAGQEAIASGWALVDASTPRQVAVLIDRQFLVTRDFYDRPDVRASLHESSPSGWRIPIDTTSLAPGEHQVAVVVQAARNGGRYYLAERTLTVVAPGARPSAEDLDENSKIAAARIREHQQSDGYWLTSHTTETRFHNPRPEMNTFLTALLIELLEPLRADDLDANVQRARQHLTAQIEPGGLVRYHGLPEGPGIGTIRCVITPDTDDTALTWRLAPGSDRARLTNALATIEQYRTREGLYRTWLSPPEGYQCLNPGSDPNPPDLTIQMHLLLLLSEVKPASSRALCSALRPVLDEDRVWVYYRKAPLVPMLRLPDLDRADCDLDLPESRMRTEVPGQQTWVSIAGMLIGDSPSDPTLMRAMLRELAREDFAFIRTNPPLLYHNDLTASVSRYYWSEDVGYALWLRLYDQYQLLSPDLSR